MALPLSLNGPSNWASIADLMRNELDARIVFPDGEDLTKLKRKRNEWTSIARLPLELLCRIFFRYKLLHDVYDLDWIRITHVCHHWRNACLDHAQLWADISAHERMQWVKPMLERSKSAPISVGWENERPGYGRDHPFWREKGLEALLSDAVSQTWRLKCLNLHATGCAIRPLLTSLASSAPVLEELCLDADGFEGVLDVKDVLLDGAPQLKRLTLIGCTLSWRSHLLAPSLTHLTLMYSSYTHEPSFVSTPALFLHTLASMRGLTELQLESAIPDMHTSSSSSSAASVSVSRPLVFPSLSRLMLDDAMQRCNDLLQHLSIPPSTKISLYMHSATEPAVTAFRTVFPAIWAEHPHPPPTSSPQPTGSDVEAVPRAHHPGPTYQSLDVSPNDADMYGVLLSLWTRNLDFSADNVELYARGVPGLPRGRLHLHAQAWDPSVLHGRHQVLDHLTFDILRAFNGTTAAGLGSSLKSLHLQHPFADTHEARSVLSELGRLERIRVSSVKAFEQVLDVMEGDPGLSLNSNTSMNLNLNPVFGTAVGSHGGKGKEKAMPVHPLLIFPDLNTLVFYEIKDEDCSGWGPSRRGVARWPARLSSLLKERLRLGYRLDKLVLGRVWPDNLTEDEVLQLKRLVLEVVVSYDSYD